MRFILPSEDAALGAAADGRCSTKDDGGSSGFVINRVRVLLIVYFKNIVER